jgi:hydroxyacylglutathione hydrolase
MLVEQFFDPALAHLSYAVLSQGEIVLIDPARNAQPYDDFARKYNARILAVIETHPHADFVSSHLEFQHRGAKIYTSKLAGARYPYHPFDEGEVLKIGKIKLKALNTPGHSPDGISIVLVDESGREHAVFTGDTLFVGDVGRPDLRKHAGNIRSAKEMLAVQLFYSLRNKLMKLPETVLVYPAHGPGSLCGKSMGKELFSTIGKEKKENQALQFLDEQSFAKMLLEDQPFIPKYFPWDVSLNLTGVPPLEESMAGINLLASASDIPANALIIDCRPAPQFKAGHLQGAINIQLGKEFETWLGSILSPEEPFFIIAEDTMLLQEALRKAAKIGYETQVDGALAQNKFDGVVEALLDLEVFSAHLQNYTILDVRNDQERAEPVVFENSLHIPLHELRERLSEIPSGKPMVVHCAAGYRSAAASSILAGHVDDKVFDLGEAVKAFMKNKLV